MNAQERVHPGTKIGHVHLKVSDLEQAERFYTEVLGFEVTTRYGTEASFLSFGDYHHHLGLNTWMSKGGPPAPRGSAGLFHFAILYPTREELAKAVTRVLDRGVPIDGASDHGVSEAIYLHDPDGNGIELYWDRDRSDWPTNPDGTLGMTTLPLDLMDLLGEVVTS
ncbi:MAG: VOC family protein [Actinobacteria bacterium]|nr:VOC family protein [Actinomycetota bacterium]